MTDADQGRAGLIEPVAWELLNEPRMTTSTKWVADNWIENGKLVRPLYAYPLAAQQEARNPFEAVAAFAESVGWRTTARCVRKLGEFQGQGVEIASDREPVAVSASTDVVHYARDLLRASPLMTGKPMVAVDAGQFELFEAAVKRLEQEGSNNG